MSRTTVNILEVSSFARTVMSLCTAAIWSLVCGAIVPACLLTRCFLYCLLAARSVSSHFSCAHPTPPHPISALLTLHLAHPQSKPWSFQHPALPFGMSHFMIGGQQDDSMDEALATEPGDQSLIPGTHWWNERVNIQELSSDHTCTMACVSLNK